MATETPEQEELISVVYGRLAQARRTWRVLEVTGVVLRGLALLLAAALAGLLVDNLLVLPGALRLAFVLALMAAAAYLLAVRSAYCLLRPLSDEMVARHVEAACPDFDNRLINAVLLHREKIPDPLTRRMVAAQLDETAHAARSRDMRSTTSRRPIWRWGKRVAGAAAAGALYACIFPQYFANALERYAAPQRYIPPITRTRLAVSPGNADVLQGDSLVIETRVEGVLPETAQIAFSDGEAGTGHKTMPFEGGAFSYEFAGVQRSFRYTVSAGDATSDTYTVSVRTRPGIKEVRLSYTFPPYMGLPDRTEVTQTGNISAPVGTTVTVEATSDRSIGSASLLMKYLSAEETPSENDAEEIPMAVSGDRKATTRFEVTRSGQYRIEIRDKANIPNQPLVRQLAALPDEPPLVEVVEPGKDETVEPQAKVTLLADAKDDFSLRSLALYVQPRDGGEWKAARSWSFDKPLGETHEGTTLDLGEMKAAPGDVVSFYFQAGDNRPDRPETAGRSRVCRLTIVDKAAAKRKEQQEQELLRSVILKLIAMQKSNLDATKGAPAWPGGPEAEIAKDPKARERFTARAAAAVKAEEEIYTTAKNGVIEAAGAEATEMLEALASIAKREITQAVEQLEALRNVPDKARISPAVETAATTEQEIVRLLERLLEDPRALLAERLEKEGAKEKVADKADTTPSGKDRAERMLESVRNFQGEQREVIKLTSQLKDKAVADFTKGDEEMLKNLMDKEAAWAKYFQETATDLSKLPPQDFSLANMAKEYLEVYSEIVKAEGAMEKKAVEIAVPLEQGGLELAKSIETNIEKWLTDTPDREKWTMEDPTQQYDVPLAELPDQLEDMIGDLMEQENELMEDAADATSAWLDSMDKGIGWDAMDGPIADMSAKGVTGNRLPDSQEVGGRSGEGRTAKSSGQFVEETATGKGGRKTPSRLTADPFEAGAVKDTSAEPATGSTGGGKVSGFGQEGFRGPVPPPLQQQIKRMANQQQQLIDRAERLDYGLRKYAYPRGQLPTTIEIMKEVKSDIASGLSISTALQQQKIVLSNLRETKELVSKQKEINRDRSALLPKELRDEIAGAQDENVPAQYKELVDSYFKALSESGSAK